MEASTEAGEGETDQVRIEDETEVKPFKDPRRTAADRQRMCPPRSTQNPPERRGCRERGLNPHEPMGDPPPQNATQSRPDLIGPK